MLINSRTIPAENNIAATAIAPNTTLLTGTKIPTKNTKPIAPITLVTIIWLNEPTPIANTPRMRFSGAR
ncbi:hypothetical protein D3C80_1713600 [compost metagenome]